MAAVAQVELRVNNSGAITAIDQFDRKVKQVGGDVAATDATMKALTASTEALTAQFQQAGISADNFSTRGKKAASDVNKAFIETKENVRLMKEEFGVEIPRSMLKVVASSKLVQSAMSAISTGLVAMGWAGIIAGVGEQLYEVGKKWFDVNAAVREYQQNAAQAAQTKLIETASLETTKDLLGQINAEIAELEKQRHDAGADKPGGGFLQYAATTFLTMGAAGTMSTLSSPTFGADQGKQLAEDYARREKLQEHQKALEEADAQSKLKSEAEYQAAITQGYAQIDAKEQGRRALIEQTYKMQLANEDELLARANQGKKPGEEGYLTLNTLRGSFDTQRRAALEQSDRQAQAERIVLARQITEQITRLDNEARNASLRGDALLLAQKKEAYAEFVRQYGENTAAREAIDRRYFATLKQQQQDAERETQRMQRAAAMSGLTGLARSDAERNAAMQDIATAANQTGKQSEISQIGARQAATAQEFNQRNKADIDAYYRELNQQVDQWTGHQEEGYARIEADTRAHVAELRSEFDKLFGGLTANDPRRIQGEQQLQAAILQVQQGADRERNRMSQQASDETARMEEEARRKWLPAEQQKTQELYDQYNERLRGFQRLLDQQQISQDDFNRRTAAAGRELTAELVNQAKEQRDKLAGELENFFDNPSNFLKKAGTHAMAEASASILMGARNRLGGMQGTAAFPQQGGFFGSLFGLGGLTLGTPPFLNASGKTLPLPTGAQAPAQAFTAAQSTMSIATATITIGSANLIGGASGGVGTPSIGSAATLPSGEISTGAPAALSTSSTGSQISMPSMPSAASSSTAGTVGGAISNSFTAAKGAADLAKEMGGSTALGGAGSKLGSVMGNKKLTGAASGAMGLYGAFQSTGGFSGAFGGAMSGAKLGMEVAGPFGAAIGAIGGAILGFAGFGGRGQAENYDKQQVRPRINNEEQSYEQGQTDYLSAYADLDSLQTEAKNTTNQFGPGGRSYYEDTIKKEIVQAQQKLSRMEKAGRSQFSFSAAQFHTGDEVTGFGDLATSSTEGLIHAQIGEFVVKPNVAARNRSVLQAMNAGVSMDQIAAGYRATMQSGSAQRNAPAVNRSLEMNVTTLDSKGVKQFFDQYKHHMRDALNSSYS